MEDFRVRYAAASVLTEGAGWFLPDEPPVVGDTGDHSGKMKTACGGAGAIQQGALVILRLQRRRYMAKDALGAPPRLRHLVQSP